MLHNIKPKRKKSKEGGLTKEELPLVKGLLDAGYVAQDIVHIVNQGRPTTTNPGRIAVVKKDGKIKPASKEEVAHFIKVQSSYDPKTLLNPYIDERLIRAREAMVSAVQIFNSPTITFKTEIFCVLSNVAWTYLLHEKMERTKKGSTKLDSGNSITVNGMLDERRKSICPIKDEAVKENLRKIIEIRDAVEHTFFVSKEECFGSLFQATCINFECHMTEWFGNHLTLAKELSLALQFVRLQKEQIIALEKSNLPEKIRAISAAINESKFANNNAFKMNAYYTMEMSSKSNSDLHKLMTYGSDTGAISTVVKKVHYTRLTQDQIVEKVQKQGYKKFKKYDHQTFWVERWKTAAVRNKEAKEYGEVLLKNQWMWFEQTWLQEVIKHCEAMGEKYK